MNYEETVEANAYIDCSHPNYWTATFHNGRPIKIYPNEMHKAALRSAAAEMQERCARVVDGFAIGATMSYGEFRGVNAGVAVAAAIRALPPVEPEGGTK